MSYETYVHHDREVVVNSELKGKHREHCLCFACVLFLPDRPRKNCKKARELYKLCVKNNMVTPVYECPDFKAKDIQTAV